MQKKSTQRLYTVAEVAKMLGISPAKTYALMILGEVKSTLFQGHRWVAEEWLQEYLQAVAEKSIGEVGIFPPEGLGNGDWQ